MEVEVRGLLMPIPNKLGLKAMDYSCERFFVTGCTLGWECGSGKRDLSSCLNGSILGEDGIIKRKKNLYLLTFMRRWEKMVMEMMKAKMKKERRQKQIGQRVFQRIVLG